MATKITQDDILNINRCYARIGTYAGVARELGYSAGTIKKYVIKDFVDPDELEIKKFGSQILPIQDINFVWDLRLSNQENNEIEELWKEISI